MRLRSRKLFETVRTEGGLLPGELLQGVADGNPAVGGLSPTEYHLPPTERLNEAITRSWSRLLGAWRAFEEARAQLAPGDRGGRITRERWLSVLFHELGYGRLVQEPSIEVDGKPFPVFTEWGRHVPIHLVGCNVRIDARTPGVAGAAGQSPHSLVQELLNHSTEHLWGIVSNGLVLRLLRDNVALTRQAYVEFDLEAMFSGEVYSDFVVLWLLAHESRVEGEPQVCWLERWTEAAVVQGTRALDSLRKGVEEAIEILGGGFLAHPGNAALHSALRDGTLDARDYYRRLLRLVYRLLFLFVAEDRDALSDPEADRPARERYLTHYSTQRLRALAQRRRGGRPHDRYEQLKVVMAALYEDGSPALGLPALGSFLWSPKAIGELSVAKLANEDLLDAIRALATVEDRGVRRSVDFRNLGAEELGSIYESLLELHPELHRGSATFTLDAVAGSERKTTGSYYTPTSLITSLLDSALEPVIDERLRDRDDAEEALLSITVCDPACGSGHFLIAAANRLAKRLGAIRTGDAEPAPPETRRAVRDVIASCVHGADMNPMAVELCKVSLWMEALDPGRPLSFLDDRIVHGNSLLGTTPELLAGGVPPEAFKALVGDEKSAVSELRKRNARELSGQLAMDLAMATAEQDAHELTRKGEALAAIDDRDLAGVRERERKFQELESSPELRRARLAADVWCAAFVAPKVSGGSPVTQDMFLRAVNDGVDGLSDAELTLTDSLRAEYAFLHWHLAFPRLFGTEGPGFACMIGNPPWDYTELKEPEFFASRDPGLASLPGAKRKARIERLKEDDPQLYAAFVREKRLQEGFAHFVRSSGRYPRTAVGRINTYGIFAELTTELTRWGGGCGLVLPTGIATDDSTKAYLQHVLGAGRLRSVLDFDNNSGFFPAVHRQTRFCLFTLGPPTPDSEVTLSFGGSSGGCPVGC